MAFFHRKILQKPPKNNCDDDRCPDPQLSPPFFKLPSPPLLSSKHSLSPYLVIMFCGLAVSFLVIFTLIYRRRQRHDVYNRDETHEDFVNEDIGPVVHPIWLINTIGLDQSQIDSLQVFKYKKDDGLIEGTDCSVCLSEFEEDESLRLLPKCSHAFHVPCIDTWLRSHKNCPLCRAPVIKNTTDDQKGNETNESNLIESSTSEEIPTGDSETTDHHVVEVENNGQVEKTSLGVRVQSDLVDRHRVQKEEFIAMRRSVSMDVSSASIKIPLNNQERRPSSQLVVSKKPNNIPKTAHKLKGSSSSIHVRSKVMKSSSFGHSLRKTNSFTNKSYYNQSY